jgi:streptogramin lyase
VRKSLFLIAVAGALTLAGCSANSVGSVISGTDPGLAGGVKPHVLQNDKAPINWTQFSDPGSGFSNTYAFMVGPDKNMYTGNGSGGIMQITMVGKTKLIPMVYVCSGGNNCNFTPGYAATLGHDSKIYMGGTNYDYNHSLYIIGVGSTSGSLTVHDIASGDYIGNAGLLLGTDNNVWFLEQKHIAKITTGGTITEFAYPSGATSNSYGGLTNGPDGNIWFTEYNNSIVGNINPSTHTIHEYLVSGCNPAGIVTGSDKNLYFYCNGYIGQITTAGALTGKFYLAFGISYFPQALSIGPDGNIWFADANGNYISEFNVSTLSITTYIPPYTTGTMYQIVLGPDGNYWGAESDNKIDVYIIKVLVVTPQSVSFTGIGQMANLTVTEPGTSSWTASSVSPGVCSVAQGNKAYIFVVTAAGLGNTKITIKDAIGNSFVVPCKVT